MIKNVRIIFLALCGLFGSCVYAMENNNEMLLVKKAEDILLFMGKVVAYKSTQHYFNHGNYTFSDSSFNYGYISDSVIKWSTGEGFKLHHLLPLDSTIGAKALTTNKIKNSCLYMRDVNAYEAECIIGAISLKKAKFSYCGADKEQEVVSYLRSCFEKQ